MNATDRCACQCPMRDRSDYRNAIAAEDQARKSQPPRVLEIKREIIRERRKHVACVRAVF